MKYLFLLCLISFSVWAQDLSLEELVVKIEKTNDPVLKVHLLQQAELSLVENFSLRIPSDLEAKRLAAIELEPQEIFQKRYKAWKAAYKSDDFRGILKKCLKEQSLSSKEMRTLKDVRLKGAYVRQLFHILDESHTAPENFSKFIVKFGKLNDALSAGQSGKAKKIAEVLSDIMENNKLLKMSRNISFTPTEGFQAYVNFALQQMKDVVATPTMSLESLHLLRKRMKDFHQIYLFVYDVSGDEKLDRMQRLIKSLIDDLGEMHDVYTNMSLRGELDYHLYQSKILPSIDHSVQRFVQGISTQSCNIRLSSIP